MERTASSFKLRANAPEGQKRFPINNHFDLMALNVENPDTFRWFLAQRAPHIACVVPERLAPFAWH